MVGGRKREKNGGVWTSRIIFIGKYFLDCKLHITIYFVSPSGDSATSSQTTASLPYAQPSVY